MWVVGVVSALFVLGCSSSKTAIVVHVGAGEAIVPASVVLTIHDGHGKLGARSIAPVALPGALTITGLSGDEGLLRIVALADSPRMLDGAAVRPVRDEQLVVTLTLRASTADVDGDGVPDSIDDCPLVADPDQVNSAGSGAGDLCRGGDAGAPELGAIDLAVPPPAVPSGLSAVAGNTTVTLSWNASPGASRYDVARATASGGPYTQIASPSEPSYVDSGLTNGTKYYYVVSAVGAGGASGRSAPVSATPAAPVANGSYRLINRSSGLALDDAGNGGVGTGLIQWTYSGAANQRWTLTSVGAYYTITCAANGLVASANGSTAAGAPIVLALPASSSDQLWTITPQSGGYYVLANRLSGLVLNDRDSSTAAGNPIDQAALGGGGAQQWSILPP